MHFTTARNKNIPTSSAKLLGITLDTRLTWANHIESLIKTLSTATYAIRRVRQIIGREAALLTYHALFHSRMSYGLELWGESAHAEKVFVVQKQAIRAVEKTEPTSHCKPLFRKYKVMTLPAVYVYQQILRARKEAYSLKTRGISTQRILRNSNHTDIPFHRTNTTHQQHKHIRLLNSLPEEWLQKSKNGLQKDLKELLCQEPIYNVEAFFEIMSNM